MDKKSNNLRLL